jgi:hypothetical protein
MRLRFALSLAGIFLVGMTLLAACSLPFGSTTSGAPAPTAAANTTPTPTVPAGAYAFVRNGDIWARTGAGPAHQVTFLHLYSPSATWGQIAWSPDQTMLAFILRVQATPPGTSIAPGAPDGSPGQGSGTVFIVNVNYGSIVVLNGSTAHLTASLTGRHLAWMSPTTLLVSTGGTIKTVTLGQTSPATPTPSPSPTIGTLSGPQNVWEIAVRGTTLWYSTIADLNNKGTGLAQLHRLSLQGNGSDTTVATFGPATLPAELCGGFVCPPDTSTPYVPYAWDVSKDGSQIVYQAATGTPNATPTPTAKPSGTATAAPQTPTTPAPSPSPTPTPASAVPHIFAAAADGSHAQPLFTSVPATSATLSLGFAPDGTKAVLALTAPGQANYGPFLQAIAPNSSVTTLPLPAGAGPLDSAGGIITWSPDGQGFSLTVATTGAAPSTPYIATFLLDGQSAAMETNATDPAWAS